MKLEDRISETFCAMDDERMEKCIHCGDVWYSIHYKNGYCYDCQQKGLHLKKETFFSKYGLHFILMLATGVLALLFLWLIDKF